MVIRVKNKKRIFAYLTIIYLLVMSGSVLHYKYMGTIGTINMNDVGVKSFSIVP